MTEPGRAHYGVDSPVLVGIAGVALGAGLALIAYAVTQAAGSTSGPPPGTWYLGIGLLAASTTAAGVVFSSALRSRNRTRDALTGALTVGSADRVLEVSATPGMLLFAALRRAGPARGVGFEPTGLDAGRSEGVGLFRANARAERLDERASLAVGDGRLLPFRDGAFDIVLSRGWLDQRDSRESFRDGLLELLRAVRPGGQLGLVILDGWRMELYGDVLDGKGFSLEIHKAPGLFGPPIVVARKPAEPESGTVD